MTILMKKKLWRFGWQNYNDNENGDDHDPNNNDNIDNDKRHANDYNNDD